MKIIQPKPETAVFGIRAMTMVGRASENGLGDHERALLAASQKVILQTDFDVDELAPISPEELADNFVDEDLRRQLVQGMVVMSVVDGPATRDQTVLVSGFASALDVDEPAVEVSRKLAERELLMFRLDFYRQSHIVEYLKSQYNSQYESQGGILGVAKALLGFRGLIEDKELASRFHTLGKLPEDTLGFAFYRHYVDNKLSFPGEKHGFPYGAIYHDFSHVLSGHSIDPEGEMLNGAFQAGFRSNENAFFVVLFVVLFHSTGINMLPDAPTPRIGRLAEDDMAERFLKELKRGAAMNTDLGDNWDFWEYVGLPLDEARSKLGIPPKE